jgi:putative phosphoesterase
MRIAILTDAHANLPALQAALAAIDGLGCEAIYHTGDAIAIGPFPAETMDLLLKQKVICFRGNHDNYFAYGLPDPRPDWMSAGEVEHQQWTHAQLDPGLRHVVKTWPLQRFEDINAQRVLFTHYALRPDGLDFEPIARLPEPEAFDAMFADEVADLVFYGHDHTPADMQGKRRYVNPGSLGCAREPVARFAVLDATPDGALKLTMHAVPYDDAPLIAAFERRRVPMREFLVKAFFGSRFQFAATRASWKIQPMPEARNALPFTRDFSATEYERLRRGLIPRDMDDHWFVYLEDDWLYWHRSWTGFCIFQVRLEPVGGDWRAVEVWVNGDPGQYRAMDKSSDVDHLNRLFEMLLAG